MVEDVAPAYRQVEELTEPVVASGRSHAGFNPASGADVKLFSAVLDGNHLVRGSATPTSGKPLMNRATKPGNAVARATR